MVRLVVSDIDGTLVKDGSHDINPELFEVIAALKQKGILFAAASGRQYPSIRRLFAPVEDNVIFIAENGAYVVCRDTEMSVVPMQRDMIEQIVHQVRQLPGCIMTASGKKATYIDTDDADFMDFLVNGYHNTVERVDDILNTGTEIVKLALYKKSGVENEAKLLIPQWKDKAKVVVAGSMWLDFMDISVDKGNALARIQQITGISKEETVCFGDNSNDLGMFLQSGQSCAVSSANPILKEHATKLIGTYHEDSVIKELKKLL